MRRSIFSQAGYLKSDDRCSGGGLTEDDVLGCGHCHAVIPKRDVTKPKTGLTMRAHCSKCDQFLCVSCGLKAMHEGCVPHDEMIGRALNEAYRRDQNAKILGI